MTRKILDRLPENIQSYIERLKRDYNGNECYHRGSEYVRGLYHAGLITDRERMLLFTYITIWKDR